MADKDFGVKRINLVGAAGTPTITSPTDLIINANKVAISTNATVGGSLGIGTTNPTSKLWVGGDGYFTGVITATKFSGQLDATSAQAQSVGFATTATNLAGGAQGSLPYQSSPGITTFLSASGTNNQVLLYDTNSNSPKWGSVSGAVGALTGITVRDEGTNVGTSGSITTLNFVGSNIQATATTGASGIATITISDTLVGTSLSISGISTFNSVRISSGIITSTTGTAVTFFGTFVGTASSAGFAYTAFTLNGVASGDLNVAYATTSGIATNLANGVAGNVPYQSNAGITTFVTNPGVSGKVLLFNGSVPVWGDVSAASGSFGGISVQDEGTQVGTGSSITTLNFVGSNIQATATTGASGIATITISDTLVGTSLSISGISTLGTVSISSGIISSTTGTAVTFIGNLTGTASYATTAGIATNLAKGATGSLPYQSSSGITTFLSASGTNNQVLLYDTNSNSPKWGSVSGAVGAGINVKDEDSTSISNIKTLNFRGDNIIAVSDTTSGISTITVASNLVGTALSISGISTLGGVQISSGIITSNIVGTSVTFFGTFVGTASSAGFAYTAFTLNGVASGDLNVAYAQTAGIATAATKLQASRNISVSGLVTGSALFDGSQDITISTTIQPDSVTLKTHTTGNYVQSITGTANQISVSGTSGEGSTPTISIPNNPTLPGTTVTIQNDLQVNRNLNVTGNITLGGTTAFLNVQQLLVSDPDIILGVRTDAFGNDVSNDTTANHGGIAIASTEGNPLVQIYNPGIGESTLPTYKKIMWFKSGSFAGLGTDAWLFNYAVGIGSTQFPAGTRLAVGSVQFTENDLAVVKNINATGVITATKFVGSVGFATTSTNLANGATGSLPYQSSSGITTFLSASGTNNQVLLYDTNSNSPKWGSVSGANGAFGGISVQDEGTQVGTGSSIVTLNFVGSNIKATATTGASGIATITIADNLVGTSLSISGISTLGTVSISSGIISSTTGTAVTFIGNLTGTASYATTAGIATHIGGGSAGNVHYQSAPNATAFVTNPGVSGKVLLFNGSAPVWGDVSAASGSFGGISVQDEGTQVGTGSSIVTLNFVGSNIRATATTGASGIATITIADNLVGTGLSISGSIGIGTTNPTSKLWVNGDGYFVGVVTANSFRGDGSQLTGLIAGVSISTNTTNQVQYLTYVTGTGSTTGFGITTTGLVFNPSTGNLGIGTTNPTSKLHVNGDLFVSGFSTFKNGLEVTDLLVLKPGQQSSNLFEILNDAQNVVVAVTTSGNLGVGSTNPTSKLWVNGDGYFTGVVTATKFFGTIDSSYASSQNVGFATTAMNVIGGIASVTSLTVSGNSIVSGFATFSSGLEVTDLLVLKPGQQSSNLFEILNDAQDVVVAVTTSGNLGIGTTTPSSKLWVNGNGYFSGVVTSAGFYVGGELIGQGGITGTSVVGTSLSISGISTSAEFVGGGSGLRNLSGTHLVSYASHSETSNSALSIAGISTYTQVGILTGSLAVDSNDSFGASVASSADGKTIIVGATGDEIGATTETGIAYVFDRIGNSFNQVGILTGSFAGNSADAFGFSVATSADGKTIIVGVPNDEIGAITSTGIVYVFDRIGNSFNQVGILTGSLAVDSFDRFGQAVTISADGKTIIASAVGDNIGASFATGIVYVFDRIGNSFNQVGILTGSFAVDNFDGFGNSVSTSADGKTIIVGASADENTGSDRGLVYIFDRIGNSFNQVGILTGSFAVDNFDSFGTSVASSADGKTIIVGAHNDEIGATTSTGVVYVFDRVGSSFNQVGILTGSFAVDSNDNFGRAVSTSADGKTIIVGAPNDEIGATIGTGIVYVFKRQGNLFNRVGILTGSFAVDSNDGFGNSVSTSADGKTIIIGVPSDETTGNSTGLVYVFDEVRETYVYSGPTGNIGIGTTNPTSKLWVNGDGYFTGVVTATKFYGDASALTGLTAGVSISTNTTNQTQYLTYVTGTGSTSGFGITTTGLVFNPSTGNLGIGTTNPTSKLTVQGNVLISGITTSGITRISSSTASPNASTPVATLEAVGSGSDYDIAIVPKGNGAIVARIPDDQVTGGNKRGTYAVDLQLSRNGATQVASGNYSFIGAGANNTVSGAYASILSGASNTASGGASFIGGGTGNTSGGTKTFVGAGEGNNTASYSFGAIVGGQSNAITGGGYCFIGGGDTNQAQTDYCVIGGGSNNTTSGQNSFIGGGSRNIASATHAAVSGGNYSTASGNYSFVAGGQSNTASATLSSVVGGEGSYVQPGADRSAILGGSWNSANGSHTSILCASYSRALRKYSSVISGHWGDTRNTYGAVVFSGANDSFGTGFSAGGGYQQSRLAILSKATTDATPSTLTADGNVYDTNNVLQVVTKSAYLVKGSVIAYSNASDLARAWEFTAAIKNTSGTPTLVGTPIINDIAYDSGASGWNLSITADSGTSSLKVEVTGQSSTTIRWVTKMDSTEVAFQ